MCDSTWKVEGEVNGGMLGNQQKSLARRMVDRVDDVSLDSGEKSTKCLF